MTDAPDINGIFARVFDAANGALRVSAGAGGSGGATIGYGTVAARTAANGHQGLYYATDGGTGGHGALYYDNGAWVSLPLDESLITNLTADLAGKQAHSTALDNVSGVNTGDQDISGKADKSGTLAQFAASTSAQLRGVLSDETGTGAAVFGTSPAISTPTGIVKGDVGLGNVDNTSDANKPVSTAAQAALDLKQDADAALTQLEREWAGVTIPFGSNHRLRSGYGPRSTRITASINTTDTTLAVANVRLTRSGVKEVFWIDPGTTSAEAVFVQSGQNTSAPVVDRGQLGTTAVAHSSGAVISRSRIRNVVGIGPSTLQDTQNSTSTTSPFDAWFNRLRRKVDERLGGVVGHGFYPIWRTGNYGSNSAREWTLSTSPAWSSISVSANYDLGFHDNNTACLGAAGATAVFNIPAGQVLSEVRVKWTDVSSNSVWTLTPDSGTAIANPNPTTNPATPKEKVSVFQFAALGVTAPTSTITITCTSNSIIHGIETYWTPIVEGVTEGWALHNCGKDGDTIAHLVQSRAIDDLTTTSGSATVGSVRAAFTTHDKTLTFIDNGVTVTRTFTFVSTTSGTIDTNAAATVAAGTPNPCVVHYGEGDWGRMLDGDPGSWVPDAIIVDPINDMDVQTLTTPIGASTSAYTATATTTSGQAGLVGTSTNYTQGDVGKLIIKTDVPAGTTVLSVQDATHLTMSANATGSSASSTILGALEATVNFAIKQNLHTLCTRVLPYADVSLHIPFEEGGTRLDGTHCTAARQATFRAALAAQAAAETNGAGALGIVTINMFDRWSKFGYANFAACNTANLMDSGDATGYHIGKFGHWDIPETDMKVMA